MFILNKTIQLFLMIILFCLVETASVWACGPFFDEAYLIRGTSDQFFALPEDNFYYELERLTGQKGQPASTGTALEHTQDADINDLRNALNDRKLSSEQMDRVITDYKVFRERIQQFINDNPVEGDLNWYGGRFRSFERKPSLNTTVLEQHFEFPSQLPQEFILYAEGALAYHKNDFDVAIQKWKLLFSLPEKERTYKSVWAAFMLGKANLSLRKSVDAISYFETTRQLVREGFHDSLNLNEESYGWQALAEFESGNYVSSIHHYLPQLDKNSLSWVCHRILQLDETQMGKILQDETSRNVILAWMVSRSHSASWISKQHQQLIKILERLEIRNPLDNADRMAWMFYNLGQAEDTKRWLKLSKEKTPLAKWISAKILLRDGKLNAGLKKLAQVVHYFEQSPDVNMDPEWYEIDIARQVNSEVGVLQLKRKDYIMALDAFLKGRYWEDAVYVAERVLTSEELENYLKGQMQETDWMKRMRHLLARRLAREEKWEKAIAYMPVEFKGTWLDKDATQKEGTEKWIYEINPQEKLKVFQQHLKRAEDKNFSDNERARAYYEAGLIMRQFGMELFGTELDPDWFVYSGQFDPNDSLTLRFGIVDQTRIDERTKGWGETEYREKYIQEEVERAKKIIEENEKSGGFLIGGEDEKSRVLAALPSPNQRFHYRYKAADLMWKASQLLPDNDDLKAMSLYNGGIYLKDRDVTAADRFYKQLVKTCGQTPLGQAADKLRWFPKEQNFTTVERR